MKVRRGTYEVSCRPIDGPGRDCGGATLEQTGVPLEVGDLRGTGESVYFVPDAKRLSRITGCKLPTSETLPGHCGPDNFYQISWAVSGDRLTFGLDDKVPDLLSLWVNRGGRSPSRNGRGHGRAGSGWAVHPEPAVVGRQPVRDPLEP
jgi:hypothetical protein